MRTEALPFPPPPCGRRSRNLTQTDMKMLNALRLFLVAGLLLAAAACGGGEQEAAPQEEAAPTGGTTATGQADSAGTGTDASLVATGQTLFGGRAICFSCHGPDAAGTQLAPNLTDAEWINIEAPVTQEKIAQLINTGVPQPKQHPAPMPPKAGITDLNDQEIQALAAYVYSLSQ